MAFFFSPVLNEPQIDANGDPLASGQIETYLAGTLTPVFTYKTETGTAHSNPIILDSAGYYPTGTQLWLEGGKVYKFIVKDAGGATLRTIDDITGINDTNQAPSEWQQFTTTAFTYLSPTSFSVVGDQTNIFQVNRRVQTTNTGGTAYGTVVSAVYGAPNTVVTLTNTSGALDSGLSAVFYALLSATNPSVPTISATNFTMATNRVLGRSTAGVGSVEELTLDGLKIAAGVLSPTFAGVQLLKNWRCDAIGISNYNVVCSADEAVLRNSAGNYITQAVSLTINANGSVGAPLSIMSARAASTWYYPWLWYNVTLGLTATLDVSPTAPTAPTGYVSGDYKALMPGAKRTDASGSTYLVQMKTLDQDSQYVVLSGSNTAAPPIITSGSSGNPATPTWTATAVGNFIPTAVAKRIRGHAGGTGGGSITLILAPNNQYAGNASSTNPPPIQFNTGSATLGMQFDFMLESTNIYYASGQATNYVACMGWRE